LQVEGSSFWVEAPPLPVPLDAVHVRPAGFDLKGVELAWTLAEGPYALHILDARAASELASRLPVALAEQLQAHAEERRRWGWARVTGWTALGFLLGLPLLLLAAFLLWGHAVAERIADKIPWEQERQIGELFFEQMKPHLRLRDETEGARWLRELGGKLSQDSPHRYQFHLVEDPEINAFALPGGIIVVHTGLVAKTRRPEELAGVLAHEIQHVELRHSLRGMVQNSGLSILWFLATGRRGSGAAGETASRMLSLKFSRDAEREADARGLERLHRAGIDPRGMPEFFEVMARGSASVPTLLSTHPLSEARQKALIARIASLPEKEVSPLPWKPWPPAM
jgi:Zn-dependent protease with chaperone function